MKIKVGAWIVPLVLVLTNIFSGKVGDHKTQSDQTRILRNLRVNCSSPQLHSLARLTAIFSSTFLYLPSFESFTDIATNL